MDAMILGDGREIWTIGFDQTVKSYVDDYCLAPANNSIDEKTSMVVMPCGGASAGKWLVFKDGSSTSYSISLMRNNDLAVA